LKFVQIATTVAPQFPTLLYAFDTQEGTRTSCERLKRRRSVSRSTWMVSAERWHASSAWP